MSSLIRTIQKRIAKARGFKKKEVPVGTDDDGNTVYASRVVNSNDEVVGKRWPQVKAVTREV